MGNIQGYTSPLLGAPLLRRETGVSLGDSLSGFLDCFPGAERSRAQQTWMGGDTPTLLCTPHPYQGFSTLAWVLCPLPDLFFPQQCSAF